jgi:hypothetical protein
MKKYVFSHISFFDNVLTSKVVASDLSALEVAIQELVNQGWDLADEGTSDLEELKNFAFNCECMFEIIEV